VDYFSKKGLFVIGYPISKNPQEQTKLQALNRKQLTQLVQTAVNNLKQRGVKAIIIYCNSLSGAVDLEYLRENNTISIITPLDVYTRIASSYNVLGLIAANCQSTANIEKLILTKNPGAIVIGQGNLRIVNDVEQGLDPCKIIENHGLIAHCNNLINSGSEIILLGCTHFTYFYKELRLKTKGKLLEPSNEMFHMLSNIFILKAK